MVSPVRSLLCTPPDGPRSALCRAQEALKKVMPMLSEANALASQLGRGVSFEAALVTTIPESHGLSPIEELYTQKTSDLLVRVVLANPRTNAKRDWVRTRKGSPTLD